MTIKIRGKEYEIKSGDYLWFNGVVWGFSPIDNSILPMQEHGFNHMSSVFPSKKEIERVMREYSPEKTESNGMTYYTFL